MAKIVQMAIEVVARPTRTKTAATAPVLPKKLRQERDIELTRKRVVDECNLPAIFVMVVWKEAGIRDNLSDRYKTTVGTGSSESRSDIGRCGRY